MIRPTDLLLLAALAISVIVAAPRASEAPTRIPADDGPVAGCTMDLTLPGVMSDILSNALTRGIGLPESRVRGFLEDVRGEHSDSQALLGAAAAHFGLDAAVVAAEVERFRHCNCDHDDGTAAGLADGVAPLAATPFARDVMLHVVLHEMGHALVREFDLPILGNEETLADAFATHYLTAHLPERAPAVLEARVASLMLEAGEVPRAEWPVDGEHNSDARRAFQIAALAVAADAEAYRGVAERAGMDEGDIRAARDYGSEIHRSWRRILRPLWVPEGAASTEAGLKRPEDPLLQDLCAGGLAEELEGALRRIDWHSYVKIVFEPGEGGASWSRSKRSITVRSGYARRFIGQGKRL